MEADFNYFFRWDVDSEGGEGGGIIGVDGGTTGQPTKRKIFSISYASRSSEMRQTDGQTAGFSRHIPDRRVVNITEAGKHVDSMGSEHGIN